MSGKEVITMYKYAGFWIRFLAAVIDMIIAVPIGCVIIYFIVSLLLKYHVYDEFIELSVNLIVLIFGWLYNSLFESSSMQATPGKRFVGIVVTDLNGERISFFRATIRWWAKLFISNISIFGYIIAGFNKKKQALHDSIAGTLVIWRRFNY